MVGMMALESIIFILLLDFDRKVLFYLSV